jgi:hypothetical protein
MQRDRRRCSSTTSPASDRAAAQLLRLPVLQRRRLLGSLAYFNAAGGRAARTRALHRHQDVPRGTADEAGPDEHVGVDREPRAVPRSQLVEFAVAAARSNASPGCTTKRILREAVRGLLPESILTRKKMGFRCRSPAGSPPLALGRAATCCSTSGRDSAAVRTARRSNGCCRTTSRRQPRRRRDLGAAQPRALVSHVHRRRRRADAARSDGTRSGTNRAPVATAAA